MKHTNKKKGFTLVELVIVIAVIAILAGVMIATFSNVVDKANKSADLQEVKSSLDAEYYDFIAEGQLPTALSVDGNTVTFATIPTMDSSKITPDIGSTGTKTAVLYYNKAGEASATCASDTVAKMTVSYEVVAKTGEEETGNEVKADSYKFVSYVEGSVTASSPEDGSDPTYTFAATANGAEYKTTATITGRKGTVFTVTLDIDETSDNFGYYTLEEVK